MNEAQRFANHMRSIDKDDLYQEWAVADLVWAIEELTRHLDETLQQLDDLEERVSA